LGIPPDIRGPGRSSIKAKGGFGVHAPFAHRFHSFCEFPKARFGLKILNGDKSNYRARNVS